ncbi:MAG: UDP-N-acetylmuramate dehydrogenase [Candidatus Saccharimonadales bacterium]
MNILTDNSLAHYTTMGIGGPAKTIVSVTSEQDIIEAVAYARQNQLKLIVIGQGSNIIFGDGGFDGLVIVNAIPGLLIDSATGQVRIGAGTSWHEVVTKTVEAGLVGVEAMPLIPGTAGATPINNVGAYGQEIKDTLLFVRAYDTQTDTFVEINNSDCAFGYRSSRFKTTDYGRFIISSITLQLKQTPTNYTAPNYPALTASLQEHDIYYPTPDDVMRNVIAIRMSKLPDPKQLANTGSFFKNPIVPAEKAQQLLAEFPNMPTYPREDGTVKLAGGWLIETAGLKDLRLHGMWVYEKQALVLVNENAHSFADLAAMVNHIQSTVNQLFGVQLEPEPEIFS